MKAYCYLIVELFSQHCLYKHMIERYALFILYSSHIREVIVIIIVIIITCQMLPQHPLRRSIESLTLQSGITCLRFFYNRAYQRPYIYSYIYLS